MRRLLQTGLLLTLTALSACNSGGTPPKTEVIETALAQPGVFILDVRSPGEFSDGHVEGAVNVPVSELARMKTILPETDRQIIVHCQSGVRSAKATKALQAMGYAKILDAKTPGAVAKAMGIPLVK